MPVLPFPWPESGSWCQWKLNQNIKLFAPSYRTDNYQVHHKVAHVGKWAVYKAISFEDKKVFYNKRPKFKGVDTLFSIFEDASSTLKFTISVPIVKVMIG